MMVEGIRFLVASVVLIILVTIKQIHIIQLNSYNLDQQIIWYKKNIVSFVLNLAVLISTILFYELSFIPAYYLVILSMIGILVENLPRKQKKKLVFTLRIRRLIFVCLLLFVILLIPIFYNIEKNVKYILYITALSPAIIFISYLITLPIENAFRKKFMNEAKEIVDSNENLYTIGITGSFGKTSVKYYLSKLLKSKYSVCMTPESYNTSMGATLTIKNDLRNIDDVFICEMGARRVGDIKEICDIVSPYGCIITDVGNMHLDTFKTIDNVLKTKFELVDSVVSNTKKLDFFGKGTILLNGDNELIRKKSEEYKSYDKNILFYGLKPINDFYADKIVQNDDGTTFTFMSKNDKFPNIDVKTNLLGKYSIINLVVAISYAMILRVDAQDIKNIVMNIEAVPHRLKLLSYDKNNLIIDDAYNSNPNGARNAVDVLNSFDGYTKIIITPGMVELYDKQDEENERFAEYAGKYIDYAIVVGHTNKLALDRGFEKNLSKDKVINMDRVEDAISYARNNVLGKKVILLENDLTDNY